MSDSNKLETPAPMTKSAQIWETIRRLKVNVYGMNQQLEEMCTYTPIDTQKCFLTTRALALLPVLEEALGEGYECTNQDRFLVIEKK